MNTYKDKVAMVTGAGSGIGEALCKRLAALGAIVVASDIHLESAARTVSEVKAAGGLAWGEQLDVSDARAFQRHLDKAVGTHGRIDYLFNNAGIAISGELRDLTVDHWRKVIDVDLNGVFYGSLAAYKQMILQGFGHIVNLSSIEGFSPWAGNAPYVAAKYAVLGFTQTLWIEGGKFGVRASAVCPGIVRTPIFDTAQLINADRERAMAAQWDKIRRFSISPERCADIILKGVERNRPIIPVSRLAHLLWWLSRLMPVKLMRYVQKDFDKWRHTVRLAD